MADDDAAAAAVDYSDSDAGERGSGPVLLFLDPLKFSIVLFVLLVLFVFYLLLPRGVRKQYFGAYPKRHAWSTRSRAARRGTANSTSEAAHPPSYGPHSSMEGSYTGGSSTLGTGTTFTAGSLPPGALGLAGAVGSGDAAAARHLEYGSTNPDAYPQQQQQNDEIVISAAMQQLRDPGVLIVAHGSRGKPKTVRLQLTETAITWRTETRKKVNSTAPHQPPPPPKMGKLHQVPLQHIMYVDVGKQTTALRRVENAAVSEALCFSLLTKEGSLDLEANSPRERDALVSCFSLVLDEVHAQNWRDIYRGPSSSMPSSFDEMDPGASSNNRMMAGPK